MHVLLRIQAINFNYMHSSKECKDIREPNKVKSVQPVIFHFLMFKVRNAGYEYFDFFNFSRGNFWCILCLDTQSNSILQPDITKFFCCLIGSPIYKDSLHSPFYNEIILNHRLGKYKDHKAEIRLLKDDGVVVAQAKALFF